jgi:membrane-bound lytic murein transglycosylase A
VLSLRVASFADLPGWAADDQAAALPALLRSCPRLVASTDARGLEGFANFGRGADWKPFCDAALKLAPGDTTGLRRLAEAELRPWAAMSDGKAEGLFTGYYEPLLAASRQPTPQLSAPLYRLPPDLVQVDLGQFRSELRGQRIAGRVEAGRLLPYADRSAIEAGALRNRALEIAYGDPVDVFFLQIQGSGLLQYADGTRQRLGFAGVNGHAYTAIGRVLADRGAMPREAITMPALREWLRQNPAEAPALLRENRAYVFFRELPAPKDRSDGPPGAGGVALLPGRSLAVDRSHYPMHLPLWLDAAYPGADGSEKQLQRLMLAQDTGGAIRGPVRGDVFWGDGAAAEAIAGAMKHQGRLWLLLPKSVRPANSASGA